ncbi:DUF1684 domain-containing protein [Flavobacterium microcysteis]|uniref:DUF1684 domain-containing protein n=1 Tax=Flavobacterium microcysteis TaxID=2596891 RepID=A0A501QGA7_9FLAO|nr:DUF1684 domain-containing protein [Flavobacterium microcysteis]TPD71127.1 DUF1684 domain-containing protein [Flavobacterium microcysteis]
MKSFLSLLFLLVSTILFAQKSFDKEAVIAFQKELNAEYADSVKSPLLKKDLKTFKALSFYPINEKFFVNAKFVRTPDEKPFEMPTSTSRKPMYVKYGEAHFSIDGKKLKVNLYQSLDLKKIEEYKDALFLPFTDLTSGVDSYGGGKYIDLKIPQGDTIVIDFNTAYNPYCAYNHKYSCPIPPQENDLAIEIRAGVKKFKK